MGNNWKFSWGPFYGHGLNGGRGLYDPPKGDYYSKPSQPHYVGLDRSDEEKESESALISTMHLRHERRVALARQAHQEPYARAHYFWLGREAENV